MSGNIYQYVTIQSLMAIILAFLLSNSLIASEVILTAENLNTSLKQIQRNINHFEMADPDDKPEYLFRLGVEASQLAVLLTKEVSVYGMQQQGLIDLAIERTQASGVGIVWHPEKGRYIYNGAAYKQYLYIAPEGSHAAESAFRLLEIEFFQFSGNDVIPLLASAERKLAYLEKYPDHEQTPEIGLLLALDYRDLWRLYFQNEDIGSAQKFSELARGQYRWVIDNYPDSRHSRVAIGLLDRFQTELNESGQMRPHNLTEE